MRSSATKEQILVLAHPDDEVLFTSSIISDISRLIFCYGPIPGEEAISNGRFRAIKNFPLKTFINFT